MKKYFQKLIKNTFGGRKSSPAFLNVLLNQTQNFALEKYADEGYRKNVIVYRCIKEIANCLSNIDIEIVDSKDRLIQNHEIIKLLNKPNPIQSRKTFFYSWVVYHLCAGNSYILKIKNPLNKTRELHLLPPHKVQIKCKTDEFFPQAYVYKEGAKEKIFPVNPINGECDILHFKEIDPLNGHYGLSPLQASAYSVDIHNEGSKWNFNLLKNSAIPSGVISSENFLNIEELQNFKEIIRNYYAGAQNTNKILFLEGGLKFEQMSLTPKDMDFQQSMNVSARNIASAFGVPFALIIPEASTYNNIKEAKESLYENTVLPLFSQMLEELTRTLNNEFQDILIRPNLDSISALENRREKKFERMIKAVSAGILSPEEARVELGY